MKKILLLIALLFLFFSVNAQTDMKKTDIEKNATKKIEIANIKKNAISMSIGFPGIGLGYARLINHHFSARVKVSGLEVDVDEKNVNFNDRKVDINGRFTTRIVDLWLDYLPFKKSSFKLVTGLSYLSSCKGSAHFIPAGPVMYGDIELGKDEIGEIYTKADWSGITPYVGLGFGRAIPKNNFGVSFEVGGYFVEKSKFVFDGSKMLSPNTQREKESNEIRNFVDQFTVMPSFMLHLSYKL
jgi:hypothetical protein